MTTYIWVNIGSCNGLTILSCHLNQCWLIVTGVLGDSQQSSEFNLWKVFEDCILKITTTYPVDSELNPASWITAVLVLYYWCAILIAHQIVMAKHGGSCVHLSGISTCGRTSRETVSHPQCPPLPTPCKIYLPIYVIVTNKLLQPLTTTWYDSLVLSISLLKI